MNFEDIKKLGFIFGSALHDEWRVKNQYRITRFKKAGKDLNGNLITQVASHIPSRINEDGILEIDILNTSFSDLTPAWKQENLDAGVFIACLLTSNSDFNFDDLELTLPKEERTEQAISLLDTIGDRIHEAWMARDNNAWAKKSPEEEINMTVEEKVNYQFLPYKDLSQTNKDLDTDQIEVIFKLVNRFGSLDNLLLATSLPFDKEFLQQLDVSIEKYKDIEPLSIPTKIKTL